MSTTPDLKPIAHLTLRPRFGWLPRWVVHDRPVPGSKAVVLLEDALKHAGRVAGGDTALITSPAVKDGICLTCGKVLGQEEREFYEVACEACEARAFAACDEPTPAAGGRDVPEGYELVLVPKTQPEDEPDWDECIRQAEVATGLKVERNTTSIIVREVRRWLAGRRAAESS